VNLIMDTFAAMALSSLPPNRRLMNDKPRDRRSFIINKRMARHILGMGLTFSAILIAMFYVMKHCDVTQIKSLGELWSTLTSGSYIKAPKHLINTYESALFFTTFVMIQFWNLFNARAYGSRFSAFHLKKCRGFVFIALLIFLGQILIINIGGRMFNVESITLKDWIFIIVGTSPVILLGEAMRKFKKWQANKQKA